MKVLIGWKQGNLSVRLFRWDVEVHVIGFGCMKGRLYPSPLGYFHVFACYRMDKDENYIPPRLRKERRFLNHESPDGRDAISIEQTVDKVCFF